MHVRKRRRRPALVLCIACRCRLRTVDIERGYHAVNDRTAFEMFKQKVPKGHVLLCNGRGFCISPLAVPQSTTSVTVTTAVTEPAPEPPRAI